MERRPVVRRAATASNWARAKVAGVEAARMGRALLAILAMGTS
jgi:hypothetical protein